LAIGADSYLIKPLRMQVCRYSSHLMCFALVILFDCWNRSSSCCGNTSTTNKKRWFFGTSS
jgi:hypothetical protein